MPNIEFINKLVNTFDQNIAWLEKQAFQPSPPPMGPAAGAPPMDPNAMPPQGGAPMPPGAPMDPSMMQGGMPPMDPSMMQGGMPPMDPNAMPPQGGAPMDPNAMPPGDPNAQGGAGPIPPELEQALSELSGGVEGIAQQTQETQAQMDQLAQRQLSTEQELDKLREELKTPAPFEGGGSPAPQQEPKPEAPQGLQGLGA